MGRRSGAVGETLDGACAALCSCTCTPFSSPALPSIHGAAQHPRRCRPAWTGLPTPFDSHKPLKFGASWHHKARQGGRVWSGDERSGGLHTTLQAELGALLG